MRLTVVFEHLLLLNLHLLVVQLVPLAVLLLHLLISWISHLLHLLVRLAFTGALLQLLAHLGALPLHSLVMVANQTFVLNLTLI